MEFTTKLFKYTYIWYCQGSEEKSIDYALLHVPKNASFNNNRSTLIEKIDLDIILDSVEDCTIYF